MQKQISWNNLKLEGVGIKGPLNPDLPVHKCYPEMKQGEMPRTTQNTEPITDQMDLIWVMDNLTNSINTLIHTLSAGKEEERESLKAKLESENGGWGKVDVILPSLSEIYRKNETVRQRLF